jgi:vitamin B12 transporter
MKRSLAAAVMLAILFVGPRAISAQEKEGEKLGEVVVTASRVETPAREVASSITVISAQEIREKQKTDVLEVLRSVPGLDVVRTGGPGKETAVFLRGAKSEQTLVLIDGVEMNDPTSPGRAYDFANLTTDNIERIEILRGPQSTLYGSDAMGGVINIITKKGKEKMAAFASGEYGSFKTFIGKAGVSGGNRWVNYSLGLSYSDTEGISAANEKDGNTEKDGYQNKSVSARVGFTPTESFDLDFIFRYTDAKADIDNFGGTGGDDPNNTTTTKQLFFRTQAGLSLFNDFWQQKLGFSLSNHKRRGNNDPDPAHTGELSRDSYDGRLLKLDWQHDLHLHKTNTLTLGVETEEERAESSYYSESFFGPFTSTFEEKTARTTGYYLQDQIKLWDSWFTTLGLRLDDHSKFGNETTYRITSAYLIRQTGTKIKGTYGTGFKAPSLYQLYAPTYGDENLKPEKSAGWDAGLEQTLWGERLVLGATYFSNRFKDLIDFDSGTSKYINIGEAETKGVELFASVQPADDLTLRASYTYTDTEDKSTGKPLLRRPKNKAGVDVGYRFLKRGNINLGLVYVGERDDLDFSTFPATRVELGDYLLVNLAASFDITKNFQVYGRIENLLDENYEEVKGYGTPGVSVFGGLKLSF